MVPCSRMESAFAKRISFPGATRQARIPAGDAERFRSPSVQSVSWLAPSVVACAACQGSGLLMIALNSCAQPAIERLHELLLEFGAEA